MRMLSPPLSVIESNLFDPSFGLIRRWVDADPSLSAEDIQSLAADATAGALRADWEAAQQHGDAPVAMIAVALPPHLAAKVQQRVAARARKLSPEPRSGLILRVDEAIGPDGPLGWDLAQPFVVLLSEPSEHPAVWYGWLMSWETDYAGYWDLLLDESDQPCDPLAAMVQTWNPVHLYLPAASAPLGELRPERLAAVRDLANDIGEPSPDPGEADPGTLVQRTTSGGHLVLTGSAMGDAADPRWRYRDLYFEVARFVGAVAREALQRLAPRQVRPWWEAVLAGLKTAAEAAGMALEPLPVRMLGDDATITDSGQPQRLGDLVEVHLIPALDGSALTLHLTLLHDTPLVVGLARGERVRQEARLSPDAPTADLVAGADQGLALFIRDDACHRLFFGELADV